MTSYYVCTIKWQSDILLTISGEQNSDKHIRKCFSIPLNPVGACKTYQYPLVSKIAFSRKAAKRGGGGLDLSGQKPLSGRNFFCRALIWSLRISKDGTSSKCLLKIFQEAIESGKNYSCIYLIYILFREKFSECFHCTGACNWEVVDFLDKRESCY